MSKTLTLNPINFNIDQLHLDFYKGRFYRDTKNLKKGDDEDKIHKENRELVTLPFNFKLENINSTNTPFFEVNLSGQEFTVVRNDIKNYAFSYQFLTKSEHGKIIPAFQINFGDYESKIKSYNNIVFYSSFIQDLSNIVGILGAYEFLNQFISENFNTSYIEKVPSRLDLCLDIPNHKKDIVEFSKREKIEFTSEIKKNKTNNYIAETYYINNKSSNKYKPVFRLYDKMKDSFDKKKTHLYPFFKDHKNVTRLEFEFTRSSIEPFLKEHGELFEWQNLLDRANYQKMFSFYCYELKRIFPFIEVGNFKEKLNLFNGDRIDQISNEKREFERSRNNGNIKIEDLKQYYATHHQLPPWHRSNGRGIIIKILEAIGPEGVVDLVFDGLSNEKKQKLCLQLNFYLRKSMVPETPIKVRKKSTVDIDNKIELTHEITKKIYHDDTSFNYFAKSLYLGVKKGVLA